MAHPLDGCRAKLLRADEHVVQLRVEVADFLSGNPYGIQVNFDRNSGYCELTLAVRADPPIRWSVILGEIVHNWHSALDYVARLLGQRSGVSFEETDFPIYGVGNETKYDASFGPKGKHACLAAHRTILDALQPYKRGADHPLWLLYDLSNIDKHEVLHVIGSAVARSGLGINTLVGWDIHNLNVYGPQAAVTGAKIADFTLVQRVPNAVLHMNPDITYDVQIGDGSGSASGKLLLPTLTEIRDCINNEVFPRFDPFFP